MLLTDEQLKIKQEIINTVENTIKESETLIPKMRNDLIIAWSIIITNIAAAAILFSYHKIIFLGNLAIGLTLAYINSEHQDLYNALKTESKALKERLITFKADVPNTQQDTLQTPTDNNQMQQ